MKTQTATLPSTRTENLNGKAHRKEDHFYRSVSALVPTTGRPDDFIAAVDLRLYSTRATHYACLWVRPAQGDVYLSGSGKAGGYGYDRASAAAHSAIISAGIQLAYPIDGVGAEAVWGAVLAIAHAAGYPDARIFVAHG